MVEINHEVDTDTDLPTPDTFDDPFPTIISTLQRILRALAGGNKPTGVFDFTAAGLLSFAAHQWQRVRVVTVVFSASAAGTAIITIGTFARTYNIGAGVTSVQLPVVIERGGDVILGGTAAGLTAYIIGSPE